MTAPGDRIGGWRLLEKLHVGGMATLWRVAPEAAPHGDGGPPPPACVMKLPRLRDHDDPTAIVGFEVEQMILPALSGPHVPRFVAGGDDGEQPWLVMELLQGPSLRARLDDAPLPPEEVASIGARIASALHALHLQHVVHLDLKPSNVMFRPDGTAVLIDFGLARHDALPDLLAEEFRLPMGTGPYISPEQVLRVRNDPRSDLFALGVLLYHLATGRRPFGNPTSVRGLKRRLWRDPPPPRQLAPAVPPWLQELILRCLEVDPAARHESAAQLALDLSNPSQVKLTGRALKRRADGRRAVLRRWWRAIGTEPSESQSVGAQLARAPIVMAAIDLSPAEAPLSEALRRAVGRILRIEPGARLACVSVLKTHRIAMDTDTSRRHVRKLAELRHWAQPLEGESARITHHVLEAPDAAAAIVDFAHENRVDHVVIGARGSSALRRYLGSVSAQVVTQAPCSVTVVRVPEAGAPDTRAQAADASTNDVSDRAA